MFSDLFQLYARVLGQDAWDICVADREQVGFRAWRQSMFEEWCALPDVHLDPDEVTYAESIYFGRWLETEMDRRLAVGAN